MVSGVPHFRGRSESGVVAVRPGPSVVHDGTTVHASVRVERRTDDDVTLVYCGTSLVDAVDAAVEELGSDSVASLEDRAYFRRFWPEGRIADVERELRRATYR